MKWRSWLKRFGRRFIISLAVLGAIYVVIFGWPWSLRNQKSNTPPAKIARLRSALDQTYIDSQVITGFKRNDIAAYSALSNLGAKFNQDLNAAQTALKQAPKEVTPDIRKQSQAVIDRQKQTYDDFTQRYQLLQKVIMYDPDTDLGKLNLAQDKDRLLQRITAAQTGLQNVANSTKTTSVNGGLSVGSATDPTSLLTADTQKALQAQSHCLDQLSQALQANQSDQAASLRASCIKNYPQARQKAIQNVIQGAFTADYRKMLDQSVTSLLKQLDGLVKAALSKQQSRSQ